MSAVDMTGATAEEYADLDALDEVDIIQAHSGAVLRVHHRHGPVDAPIWEHEFADRWASLQPLLNRTLDEEVDRG